MLITTYNGRVAFAAEASDADPTENPGVTLPRDDFKPAWPQDPLIAAYGNHLGPRIQDRLNGLRVEFGTDTLANRSIADRIFKFVEGTALGIRLLEKVYAPTDAFVQASEIRRVVLENIRLQSGTRNLGYVETSGLAEIGTGFTVGIGLNALTFARVGFNFSETQSTILQYRTSMPVAYWNDKHLSEQIKTHKVAIPLDAQTALKMHPGSEVELTGQGSVFASIGLSARVGYNLPIGTVGLGFAVGAKGLLKGEYNLNILALDKPGFVRVTIRKLDEKVAAVLMRIRAGLVFGGGSITGNLIGGNLLLYAQKMGASNFEELINLYTTLNSSIYASTSCRDVAIQSFDFDLNQPMAMRAYDQLVRLNTIPAQELAKAEGTSVMEVEASESESEIRIGADLGAFGQKLLISETLETERTGQLNRGSAPKLLYRDSIFTKRKKSIYRGTKDISWEAVSTRHTHAAESESFLHLRFQQRDWDFSADDIQRMVRFSIAMQIPDSEVVGDNLARLDKASVQLSKMAEVNLLTDVYFTKKGIENIDKADASAARDVYLKVSSTIRNKFKKFDFTRLDEKTKTARDLIDEYRSHTGLRNISKLAQRLKVLPKVRREYLELTGRKIDADARLISQAEQFGRAIERLTDTTNADQVASLFLSLGKLKGFDYMQTIAALSTLAGANETYVNELSIRGGGICIQNASEGLIGHPRDAVALELNRLAEPSSRGKRDSEPHRY